MGLPLAVPLIAQGVTSLSQIVGGAIGGKRARDEYENAEVPNYFDTEAYKTAESTANQAYRYAQEGLPEESRRFAEDNIGRSGAAALATTGSLRSGIAGVGQTASTLADSYRNLAGMDAQQRIANRGQYFQQMGNLQRAQDIQANREYGQFLNQQSARLARMTANRNTMNQGIQGLSQAGTLAFMGGTTPREFGGFMQGKRFGGETMNPMETIGAGPIGSPVNPLPIGMTPRPFPSFPDRSGAGGQNPFLNEFLEYGLQQQGVFPLGRR
jgi:hypothetical protein